MKKPFVVLGIAVVMVFGVYAFLNERVNVSTLGGGIDEDYRYTYISSSNASSTAITTIKTGRGTLGGFIVGSTSPTTTAFPQLVLYDNASSTEATSTMTRIGTIGAGSTANGAFQFDAEFSNGLKIEVPATYNGTITLLWR